MEDRKLSQKEIQKIYKFVKQNGVPYLDLQHELVDHIANGIEAKWSLDKSKTFNQYLYAEYDDFQFAHEKNYPISNFSKILKSRTRSLERYWINNLFNYLKEYFKLPLIVITLLLFGGLMSIFKFGDFQNLSFIAGLTFMFLILTTGIFYLKYRKEFNDYLIIRSFILFYYNYLFYTPLFIIMTLDFFPVQDFFFTNVFGQMIVSISLSLWVIVSVGSVTTFPKIIKQDFLNQLNMRLI